MGQQQQTVAEQAGDALRRIILVLAVAALMAAMMVVMAEPAFADPGGNGKGLCDGRGGGDIFHQDNGNTENHSGGGAVVKHNPNAGI